MNEKLKELRDEWRRLAPAWIEDARGRNPVRNGLLDFPVLEACADVRGKRVLDCGCGEGRLCRKLVELGAAYVLGLDACEPMIEAANHLRTGNDEYRVADVEDLSFLGDAVFDLAISYLNQCDLLDFNANNREVFRVLRPGGRFVVANLHPMRSATGGWHKSANGEKEHAKVDRYFDESERHWRMLGCDFTNFHRTLAAYLDGFLKAGFVLERLIEPTVSPEQLAKHPDLSDELRVPNFIVYVLAKPVR